MSRWRDWLTRPRQAEPDHPWSGMDAAAVLAAWAAGEGVWTCRMADMGPAYEQAIHELGMAILQAMLADPFDFSLFRSKGEDPALFTLWQGYTGRILASPGVRAQIDRLAPEGLQVSAAMNVAGMFARNGYEAEMNRVPAARRILVSRSGARPAP